MNEVAGRTSAEGLTGAAGSEDAGCFIEADRTFAAQDPQKGLAVHADLAGDLVPRLVGALDSMGKGARDTVVRVTGDGPARPPFRRRQS